MLCWFWCWQKCISYCKMPFRFRFVFFTNSIWAVSSEIKPILVFSEILPEFSDEIDQKLCFWKGHNQGENIFGRSKLDLHHLSIPISLRRSRQYFFFKHYGWPFSLLKKCVSDGHSPALVMDKHTFLSWIDYKWTD